MKRYLFLASYLILATPAYAFTVTPTTAYVSDGYLASSNIEIDDSVNTANHWLEIQYEGVPISTALNTSGGVYYFGASGESTWSAGVPGGNPWDSLGTYTVASCDSLTVDSYCDNITESHTFILGSAPPAGGSWQTPIVSFTGSDLAAAVSSTSESATPGFQALLPVALIAAGLTIGAFVLSYFVNRGLDRSFRASMKRANTARRRNKGFTKKNLTFK